MSKETIKNKFKNGMIPDENDFGELIDFFSVDEARIIDSSVTTSKIQDGAITEEKIADGVLDKVSNFDQVTINNGKTYPLKNVSRDGQVYNVTDEVKNTVLDVKVHGAEKGKYYVLMYVANGLNGSYGFTIGEYDIEPDGGFKHSTRTTLVTYNNGGNFSDEPTSDIVHRTLNIPDKSLTFDIIYDRTAINVYPLGLDINNTQSGKAIGTVIHPNNYIYNQNGNNAPDGIEITNNKVFMDKKADRFTIYTLKSNGNYVGIEIRHQSKGIENNASSNFDLWLVRTIKEYSRAGNNFNPVRSIIDDSTPTTMDLMIKESNDMDYMGGINHGDEINDFAMLLVDGKPIDLSAAGFYEAKEVRLIQRNKLYRDTVYTDGVLEHLGTVGKEHVFNYEDGYTLHNRVTWHESINIIQAFLGSLSMYRKDEKGNSPLWHTAINDITHTPYDLKTIGGQMPSAENVERVILTGEKLSCIVEVDRLDNIPGNPTWVANFAEHNSKLYFSYVPSGYTTSVDEVWKQSTKFNFELS